MIDMSMMYDNPRKMNGDYFQIKKLKKGKFTKEHYINLINFDNYYIFKTTNKQKQVSKEDVIEFKNAGYTFFNKDLYDIKNMERWIEWKDKNKICINYLTKPFPPFNPNKVIIK